MPFQIDGRGDMNAFVLTSPLAGVMLLTRRQPFYPSAAHDKFFSICTAFGGYTKFGIAPLLCMRPVVPLYRTPQYSLIVVSQIWFTTLAHKQEAAVSVHRVRFGLAAPCDHALKCFSGFFTHRHFADTALAFRRVDIEPFICLPQELMVDIDNTVRKVDIIHCQPAELGNAQSCFQQDKDFIIIPAVDRTDLQEL